MQCFFSIFIKLYGHYHYQNFHAQQIPYPLVDSPFSSLCPVAFGNHSPAFYESAYPGFVYKYSVRSLVDGFSKQSFQCSSMLQHISDISTSFLLMTK